MILKKLIKLYQFYKKKLYVTKKMKAKNMENKVERKLINQFQGALFIKRNADKFRAPNRLKL